ncbi:ribosomal RNA small subunit methyltransferase I [Thalassobacillus devorans]|uniref:Ribosomal RNA small subunit methyltransferase I n=1 Tax=Thalassobacillus devorans TaxID=279813 RepID=A0ABQ1PV22_9BACI|nr:16S rRNA (cytidine(1402)-2'-O)-methyltransferase [Thalassobacillus devorans]NIK30785.1 16S rRNA (cytidine1402-2'-O)-methyltransferase [Thalassobacillus devorans]GGD04238.1 ribosomal RNA small subunit methyltransferase I [Thalassobacillus devorans]
MEIQKSFAASDYGTLYIVPTPIGNLEDMTFRAVRTLQEAAKIAAEDTRNTKKLLSHFDIHTPLVSYHEHNKHARENQLIEILENGEDLAIVSDAGMPGISDPGYELIQSAIASNIPVVVLPGANAALCALIGSGLETEKFYFYGFLPRKKKDREQELEGIKSFRSTLVFYESPHRLKETLKAIQNVLGKRKASLSRELTKRYEEYLRGNIDEVLEWAETNELRGEFCIVVEGNKTEVLQDELWWSSLSVIDHVEHYINNEDMSSKQAIKQAAIDRKLPKREVYQAYHVEE